MGPQIQSRKLLIVSFLRLFFWVKIKKGSKKGSKNGVFSLNWTRISNNKVESGVVSNGYLYDEYRVNQIGEINGDGTLNFKGFTLSK